MGAFLKRHKKLHIWLAADLCALAAFWAFRGNRAWMNVLADQVTSPLRQAIGRVCYLVEISIMEVLGVLLMALPIERALKEQFDEESDENKGDLT